MDYETFKEMVQDRIKGYLPEDYGSAGTDVKKVHKVNQVKDSLVITREGRKSALPNIYIDDLYEEYKKCGNFEDVIRAAADDIQWYGSTIQETMPDLDKDSIKDNAVMCLVNTAQNMEMLQNVPHRPFHDLSVIYRWIVGQDSSGIRSVIITNRIMEEAGLSPDRLFQYAAENTKKLFPVRILPMEDLHARQYIKILAGQRGLLKGLVKQQS